MFKNFSFEAASRHPSALDSDRAYMNVSPTSSPYPYTMNETRPPTPPAVTMGELAQRFSEQNLHVEVDPRIQRTSYFKPLTPPFDDVSFQIDSAHSSQYTSYTSLSPAAIRLQRQANMRLQCSATHVKDISSLVERMVERGEQCMICSPPGPKGRLSSTSSGAKEDEDVRTGIRRSSTSELPTYTLKYRRSGELLSSQACVSKSVRLRKKKYRRSATSILKS